MTTRFSSEQLAYAAGLSGYLDRAASLAFLKTMDIRMAVGHWSAGDFCDRFAPPGYHSDDPAFSNDFEGQCRRIKAAGIDFVEIHQSVFEKTLNGDLDHAHIERAQKGYLAELGMTVTTCNINTWTNPKFRLGGPCNPDPALLPTLKPFTPSHKLYGGPAKLDALVELAEADFARDGIHGQLAVVGGALDGIERVLQAELRPGDRVVLEDPSWPRIADLVHALGLQAEPARVDERGLVPGDLKQGLGRGARAVIATPRGQNPTGAAVDEERARELREVYLHPFEACVRVAGLRSVMNAYNEVDGVPCAADGGDRSTAAGERVSVRPWPPTR